MTTREAQYKVLSVNADGITADLRVISRWLLWRLERRKGNWTKVPYQSNGRPASSTDPKTWSAFPDALAALHGGGFSGLGFVFNGDGIMGVDLDGCRDVATGALEPWAMEIIRDLASYAELSPSGTGVHVIVKAKLPPGRRRKGAVEMYESGRFFCMSGHKIDGAPPEVREAQAAVDALHARTFGPAPALAAPAPAGPPAGAPEAEGTVQWPIPVVGVPPDKFIALVANHPTFKLTWDRRRNDFADQSASTYDLAVVDAAAWAQWTDEEILALLWVWRGKHNEDLGKLNRQDYVTSLLVKARESCRPGAAPAMASPEALAVIRGLLSLGPAKIVRQVSGDESTFFFEMPDGARLGLGGPETILSGARLQARLMGLPAPHARLIPRYKTTKLQGLGNALLSIGEVVVLPGNAEMTQDHIWRLLGTAFVLQVRPDETGWFCRDKTTNFFWASGPVLGCAGDTATYVRIYVSLSHVERTFRQEHIQCSGRSLAADLTAGGWRGFRFQAGERGRRLWRSPCGFWTTADTRLPETPRLPPKPWIDTKAPIEGE